ncbi:unnamed protein product, partial [Amoebophrya sp. A25]|eukprot:GSA25T00013111001.1
MVYYDGDLRGEFADIVRFLLHRFAYRFTDSGRFSIPPDALDSNGLRGLLLPKQRDAYLTLQMFADAAALPEPPPPPPADALQLQLLTEVNVAEHLAEQQVRRDKEGPSARLDGTSNTTSAGATGN